MQDADLEGLGHFFKFFMDTYLPTHLLYLTHYYTPPYGYYHHSLQLLTTTLLCPVSCLISCLVV